MHSKILGPAGIVTQDYLNIRCSYTAKQQGPCRGVAHDMHITALFGAWADFMLCIIKAGSAV